MRKKLIFIFIFLFGLLYLTSCSKGKNYEREEDVICFGRYPQIRITDEQIIKKLNDRIENLPTKDNLNNWNDFNYYVDGEIKSYAYYIDIDKDNDNELDYRGIYFTQYRPSYTNLDDDLKYYQEINEFNLNEIYWFKYENIEWKILKEEDGKALILSNLLLDSRHYYNEIKSGTFDHNGSKGYANNYELSDIRNWLNDEFYNVAFNGYKASIIEKTLVDNSIKSMGNNDSIYYSSDTRDLIFLLSYREASNLLKTDKLKMAKGSDYAKAIGLNSDENGNSYYWLRSPFYRYANYVSCVDTNGKISYKDSEGEVDIFSSVNDASLGVRPAMWIKL